MILFESVMEVGAVLPAQHAIAYNVKYFITEFTDWNENSYMNCLIVPKLLV